MADLKYSNIFDNPAFIVATAKNKLFITETESIAKNPTHLFYNLETKHTQIHTYYIIYVAVIDELKQTNSRIHKIQTNEKLWSGHNSVQTTHINTIQKAKKNYKVENSLWAVGVAHAVNANIKLSL